MRVFDKAHPIIIAGQGGLWQGSIALGDRYRHTFGGPLDLSVRGFPTNRRPLHRLLTLIAGPRLRDRRSSLAPRLPPYRRAPGTFSIPPEMGPHHQTQCSVGYFLLAALDNS
jgi:hypothetical protein